MKPIQNSKLLTKMITHGQLPRSAPNVPRIGWGFVSNAWASEAFAWQGYFLGAVGGLDGPFGGANLGVLFALVIGFGGYLLLGRAAVRRQDALGATAPVA